VAFALVALAGCDTAAPAWRAGRMDCRIHPIERTSAEDPFALHRHAVSPLVAPVLRATHDVRAEWRRDHGLVLEPAGAEPSVIVPAPLPLRRSEESVLVLDVTTPGALTLEVRWTDARCRTPAAPCRLERPVSTAGRQEIYFDLGPALDGAVESIAIGLRDATGPVTVHAVRVGAEARRPAGSHAVAVSLLSPSHAPALLSLPGVDAQFVDGAGLRVGAFAAAGGRRAFGVPVAREATDIRYLVADIADNGARGLRLYYTSPACLHFNEHCALEATQVTPGTFVADMGASPRWQGTIGALYVDVDVDGHAEVTVRALRFVSRAEHAELVAGRTQPIVLLAPDVAPALARAPDALVSFVAGEGLRARAQGPQPRVVLRFEHAAAHAGVLTLDLATSERQLQAYFTSPQCPVFDEACRATLVRVARDRFAVDLAKHPAWSGLIEHLRLDLPPRAESELTIRGLRFEPPERAIDLAPFETGSQTRGVDGRSRLPGGRIGWEVVSGHELDCRFGAEEGLRRLPRVLELRVPPDPTAIEFGALHAEWELPDGSRRPAARVVDAFADPRAAEWTTVGLDPPGDPPLGLRVTVSCHKNCRSLGRPALRMHVAQPVYRVLPRSAEPEPRHLLLVSLDTLRADHLSVYGYGARTDPFLARWAEQATVYEAAYAVDTWTVPTHAAMLSGRYPTQWGDAKYHRLPSGETTLAEVLAARGWATIGVADGLVVTAAQGLDQGFDRFDSRFEPLEAKVERFTQLLAEAEAADVPVFAFLHTYEVHNPFQLPEGPLLDGVLARVAGSVLPVWSDPVDRLVGDPAFQANREAVLRYLTALYDGSIRVADAALDRLLNDPRLARFMERAVVVITADHGEEFLERGGLGHTRRWPYPELTHVPLLVRAPGQVGGRREPLPISQTNVARLALEAMGVPPSLPPGPCTDLGVPLALLTDEGPPDYPRQQFLTIAAFGRDGTYMRTTDRQSGAVSREEGEADDAVRASVACLEAELSRSARARAEMSPAQVSPDARQRLRALGYVVD
jgi:arylsulfatase